MSTKKNNKKVQSSYKGTTIFVQISPCNIDIVEYLLLKKKIIKFITNHSLY